MMAETVKSFLIAAINVTVETQTRNDVVAMSRLNLKVRCGNHVTKGSGLDKVKCDFEDLFQLH